MPEWLDIARSQFDDLRAMIRLMFTVRYQSQLRRVRPEVMAALETSVTRAIRESGGQIALEGAVLKAAFDDSKVAFWLDLVVALDGIAAALATAAKELFGCACLVHTEGTLADPSPSILRELSRLGGPTGIWCDPPIAAALAAYADFADAAPRAVRAGEREIGVLPLASFKLERPRPDERVSDEERKFGERVESALASLDRESGDCLVIRGSAFHGRRRALRAIVRARLGSFPPYFVRFGSGGSGLACLADAVETEAPALVPVLDEWRRSEGESAKDLLDAVLAERLRAEPSPALAEEFERFLTAFAASYAAAARSYGAAPLFVLEDAQNADPLALRVASAAFGASAAAGAAVLLVTSAGNTLPGWRGSPLRFIPADVPPRIGFDSDIPALSDDVMEYYYALSLLAPLFAPADLISLFALEGKPTRSLEHALATLAAVGAIESADDPSPSLSGFAAAVERRLGAKAERVRALARRRLLASVAAGRARPSFGLLSALAALGGDCDDDLALDAVEAEAGDDTLAGLEGIFASERLASILGRRSSSLVYIARARCALRRADEEGARSVFAAPAPDWYPADRYQGAALADMAAFFLGIADIPRAEARAKEAILLLQGRDRSRALARAYRLLGLVELAKERVSEAIDYFTFAKESADAAGEQEEAALDAAYIASAEFIWGNTAKAERFAAEAETLAGRAYRRDWAQWARFFRGRLRFEAGCYRDAVELFDSLLAQEEGGMEADARTAVAAWAYRARVYGSIHAQKDAEGFEAVGDCGLFILEDLYFARDYDACVDLADRLLAHSAPRVFRSPERPVWNSGFALAEDLALAPGTVLRRLVRMLRSLSISARARLSASSSEDLPRATEELRRLVKDENLTEADPYDSLYYRAYCQTLEASSAAAVDVSTALSVAFQRVQRRASRIDEAEAKRSYLYINRWNAGLLAAAKAHNLI